MTAAHYTPMAAAQEPLFWWRARPRGEQHAFRSEQPFRSLCGDLRWSVKLGEAAGPFCGDCRAIVWSLTDTARDYVVDTEARL